MQGQLAFKMVQAQLGHILAYSQTIYCAVTITQLLILAGLWSICSHLTLLIWFGSMQVVGLSHFILCRKYMGAKLAEKQTRSLKSVFIYNALVTGTGWGSLVWLLRGTWDIHAFFILLPIMGIFAGAMNKASILPVYFALVIPILAQSMAVLLFSESANLVVAGFFAIYYAGMILFSLELNKMLKRMYSLQLELEASNNDLVIQKQVAEQANIDKSRFLAAASHDLRQPLYVMDLFLGSMAKDKDNSQKEYLLSRMRRALDGMQEMFASLLDMSRFDAGVIRPAKVHFSGTWLLQSLSDKFEDECSKKSIRLRVRSCDCWVFSDPVLIQRVLENFIANAVKHTDTGGVLVACRKRGEHCRFEVWDTGSGIREKDMDHIYDAFHQLDNPERDRRKGVGLGLAIVDQIAKLLQAPVSVRSTFGRGSFFAIDVPIGDAAQQQALATVEYPSVDMDVFVNLEVWLVDDDVDILEGLELQLETWGCITRTFESYEQVQDAIEQSCQAPALLITDLRLRDHNSGIQIIRMIHKHAMKPVPAIIITGDTGPSQLQETSRAGFPVLHKPVTAAKLQREIMEVLS